MNDQIAIAGFGLLLFTSLAVALFVVLSRLRRKALELTEVWQQVAHRRGLDARQPTWLETLGGTDKPLISGSSVVQGLSVTLVNKPGKSTHLSGICPWVGESWHLSISFRPANNPSACLSRHGIVAEWYPETLRQQLDDKLLDAMMQTLSQLPTFAWCSLDGRDAYRQQPACTLSLKGHCSESRTLEMALDALQQLCEGRCSGSSCSP